MEPLLSQRSATNERPMSSAKRAMDSKGPSGGRCDAGWLRSASNKGIATSNKCLTSNKKLLETGATLLFTSALLVVTRS